MQILHISDFKYLRLKSCYQNSMAIKISNGLIRNGHAVINYPERDLCRHFGFGHMNSLGKKRLQRHLIDFCRNTQPQIILLGHADVVEPQTLAEIKHILPNVRFVQWTCDAIDASAHPKNFENMKRFLDFVDTIFITTGQKECLELFKTDKNVISFFPNIADKANEFYRMFEHDAPNDLLFCCGGTRNFFGSWINVNNMVEDLISQIPDLKVFYMGTQGRSPLSGFDYMSAFCNANMGLNISLLNDVYLYSSDRMAHLMGNGLLTFVAKSTGFGDMFTDQELVLVESFEDLRDKISFYKNHPQEAQKIAKNGWQKYHEECSDVVVTKYMMDIIERKFESQKEHWTLLK